MSTAVSDIELIDSLVSSFDFSTKPGSKSVLEPIILNEPTLLSPELGMETLVQLTENSDYSVSNDPAE